MKQTPQISEGIPFLVFSPSQPPWRAARPRPPLLRPGVPRRLRPRRHRPPQLRPRPGGPGGEAGDLEEAEVSAICGKKNPKEKMLQGLSIPTIHSPATHIP